MTKDVDFIAVVPRNESVPLIEAAGRGSLLHHKYGLYLDFVSVATVPENYDTRLREMPFGGCSHLTLLALDPYDLALAKLERNSPRDREDVNYLAHTVPLDLSVLQNRYRRELRPYLAIPEREDMTLRLWIEVIQEERQHALPPPEPNA